MAPVSDVVCDPAYLQVLADEFYKSDEDLLGKLELDSDHVNMHIYKPNDDTKLVQDLFRKGRDLLLIRIQRVALHISANAPAVLAIGAVVGA